MKTIQLLLILTLSFALTQCQKEETEIINEPPPTESIVAGSPLTRLLLRTSQNPTACDDVLDNSSCFSVQLPVTVVVNGVTITVNSESDYQSVQDAKNLPGDDVVNFNYPITIRYDNFTTQVVTTQSQLNQLVNNCDDDGFNEIDCILINYPIVVNFFNTNNQVANSVTIQNNAQLFNYITSLTPSVLSTIVYPISVTNSVGVSIVISNNNQLEDFIEDSIDDCDDSSIPNPGFVSVLTSGTWRVTYFYEDDDDETTDYLGYNFTFNPNFSILVEKNSVTSSGTWSNYMDDGDNKLDLLFSDSNLDELEDDWKIVEYTTTEIRLRDVSGGDGSVSYLYFTKN